MRTGPTMIPLCVLALGPLVLPPRVALGQEAPAPAHAGTFRLVLDPAAYAQPYTGRVYVVLATNPGGEPRLSMGEWFGGPQVFSMDVSNLAPGQSVIIGPGALGFPKTYPEVRAGLYTAQAVARAATDSPGPGRGAGDLYSQTVPVDFAPIDADQAGAPLELRLTRVVEERPFPASDRVKLVEIVSPSLSKFYGREVKVRAGVRLPVGWTDEPGRRYPTVYFITGFGGDHTVVEHTLRMMGKGADDVLVVVPDPLCALGHSVFADSDNNGPRGRALIEELIPAVETKYHGAGDASRRYVTGISSGGWGSLWLQIAYPDSFNGVWSHCPDPVDFRDFQRINLYEAGANMYTDAGGQRRPLARQTMPGAPDQPFIWYDDFVRQESVLGPGGQIHSFEAVFSPRGPDGRPVPLFDRATGVVNQETARAWEKYDIRLVLERNWATLGPKLKGKLHVYAGERDTFYLEGAARLLFESLASLGSDAETAIVPGMAHTIYRKGMESMFRTIREREKAAGAVPHEEPTPVGAK
jgi:S-formylglutathione hydrolase FrmB